VSPLGALAVTALGAATAVGRGAVASAAAIRAGIVRPRGLIEPEVLDEETHEPVAVIGHPVRGVTDGFAMLGRWLRLANAAVGDLLRSTPGASLTRDAWRRTALILATPVANPDVFLAEPEQVFAAIHSEVGLALLEELELAIPAAKTEIAPYGHVAFAAAVERAKLRIGVDCDRVLLVAVDSLIDPLVLECLINEDRLKHGGNPVGLAPGEAAVAVLLEPALSTSSRAPLALVLGSAIDRSERNVHAEVDRAVANVCDAALADAGMQAIVGEIYLDLTGEVWRARQWGNALPTLQGRLEGEFVFPAACVGDVGAASGALAACLATRAFERGYGTSGRAVVVSMADNGSLSCVVLARPGMVGS